MFFISSNVQLHHLIDVTDNQQVTIYCGVVLRGRDTHLGSVGSGNLRLDHWVDIEYKTDRISLMEHRSGLTDEEKVPLSDNKNVATNLGKDCSVTVITRSLVRYLNLFN